MDHLAGRYRALDGAQEAQELLMPVALHAAAEHRALEHVEGGEQGGGAVPAALVGARDVIVPALPGLSGSPGWVRSALKSVDSRRREHERVLGRVGG